MKQKIEKLSETRPDALTWSQVEIKLFELQKELCEKRIDKAKIDFEIKTKTIHKDYYEYKADHQANDRLTQYIKALEEEIKLYEIIRAEIAEALAQYN